MINKNMIYGIDLKFNAEYEYEIYFIIRLILNSKLEKVQYFVKLYPDNNKN